MSVLLQFGDLVAQHAWLADPVTSDPIVPGDAAQGQANTLWGILKWVGIVVGVLAMGGAAILMGISHQTNRPNDGMNKIAMIAGSLGALFAIPAAVGLLTGT